MEIHAIVVNYSTVDLTRRAVWSLRSVYPDLHITIVDNGSPDGSADALSLEFGADQRVTVAGISVNLHHGPAMDHGIRRTEAPWVLLFDSDCIAYRRGFLEGMLNSAERHGAYLVGSVVYVDRHGFNVAAADRGGTKYVHPHCALVNRATYLTLPPFDKHGAPCLTNVLGAAERSLVLVDFPVSDYVYHMGRGTVERHGYGLGARSVLASLGRRLGRLGSSGTSEQ